MLLLLAIISIANTANGFNVNFIGASKEPIPVSPAKSTGLLNVFVVYDMAEVSSLSITGIDVNSLVDVSIYSNLGGGYAQRIEYNIEDGKVIVPKPKGDMGYILNTNDGNLCFWIVNYANKKFEVNSVEMSENQQCEYTELKFDGYADAIKYYSIAGQPVNLDRKIEVSYQSVKWDDTLSILEDTKETKEFSQIGHTFTISPALYCTTTLVVEGDYFLKNWGEPKMYESPQFKPNGLFVHTIAIQTNENTEEGSNQIKNDGIGLGGSAPADFVFTAYTSEGVIHNEWQISEDPNFENIKYRFTDKELNHTFFDEGKYYVRFVGSNSDGSCEVYGEEYAIGIGASNLRIPNVFSPDDDGINDIWKVGYSSLIEFKCWIFDRNGKQLFYFDNPQLGWDGKYKGKTVPAGVYYYVIEARGADGVKYKKGGDINIINYKKMPNYTE